MNFSPKYFAMANYFPVSFKLIIEETKAKFLPKSRSISVPNSLVKILHLMCYDTLGVVLLGKLQESRYQAPYLSVQGLHHCQEVSRGFLVLFSKLWKVTLPPPTFYFDVTLN